MMNSQNKNKDEERSGLHAQQAALDARAAMQSAQAWARLEMILSDLYDFAQPKPNVHKEIKSKITSAKTAFRRLKELVDKETSEQRPVTSFVDALKSPATLRTRTATETSGKDTDATENSALNAEANREIRTAKRRQRTSPGLDDKALKKQKASGKPPPQKEAQQTTRDTDWQTVGKKGKKGDNHKVQPSREPHNNKKDRMKTRRAAMRPDALIVRPKDKAKYSEVLSRVRKDVPTEQAAACVDAIRRTTTGDLLIVLTKGSTEKSHELQRTIADLLGDEAQVISKGPQEDLEIRDIEEDSTKESVLAGLQKAAGEEHEIGLEAIKSLRKAYRGTQTAAVTVGACIVSVMRRHERRKKKSYRELYC